MSDADLVLAGDYLFVVAPVGYYYGAWVSESSVV